MDKQTNNDHFKKQIQTGNQLKLKRGQKGKIKKEKC